MYQLKPKEIEQAQMVGVVHPYLQSKEWWIIITSNDALPILELRLEDSCPGLVVDQDIKSWEEIYTGFRKFEALLIIIRHDKISLEQIQQCFGDNLSVGKDVLACISPEHPEYAQDLMNFVKKLSDFMNESDKMT